ncbi:GntR family transcriptional regulator [Clostridium beijerinckii]|nr:GntR family transcriptional regulator [Clostridium beijerinckii]NRT04623.1 GntR family transcriptional regulator [Clostridium beijerinckii]NRT98231.1 GntR family transcriptional regulator [Clostridium beijerinckii]NRU99676.1 GntR family transcriptional regulator [Clostridium beijerinckii]NRV20830.1 GntR family transcriptional regulator [Clostridium beijerinckii]
MYKNSIIVGKTTRAKRGALMSTINKNSNIPLYVQLMNILIEKIESSMEENEKLDSEREICKKYAVSRTTVREALDELEKNNYIYKVQGKGNFISPRVVEQDLIKVSSFTEEMKKRGKNPTSKLLNFEIMEANSKVSKKLNIEKNELVYKISRIRIADNIPMIYEMTYLPYERFKQLTKDMIEKNPLYEILKNTFNISITSAEEVIESVLINKLESVYLEIPQGQAGLKFERIAYEQNEIVEYTITIARGDKYRYRVCLKN